MYCQQCGAPISEADLFCGECGAGRAAPSEAPGREAAGFASASPEKRKQAVMIAATAVAAVLLVAAFVVAPALDKGGSGSPSEKSSQQTASSQQSVSSLSSSADASSSTSEATKEQDDYVLSDSAYREYSRSELNELSDYELYIARNEIYARHGRGFKNNDLMNYFSSKSWYVQKYTPEQFESMESPLNAVEKANAEAMLSIEKDRNSSYLSS